MVVAESFLFIVIRVIIYNETIIIEIGNVHKLAMESPTRPPYQT